MTISLFVVKVQIFTMDFRDVIHITVIFDYDNYIEYQFFIQFGIIKWPDWW